ncbi:hypothetical protein QUF76_00505 [Desulfobacterales bacterium HSG16]|nr:hypothetical protein [Desulfobacterales bacterium HSG16]
MISETILKTRVYLTIDLECKKDSGNVDGPVEGRFDSCDKAYGLDFILETLERYSLVATFFTEPFFSYRFGKQALQSVCDRILSSGHDIELHLHPGFKSKNFDLSEDFMFSYDYEKQKAVISEGIEILLSCGASEPTAFRAGHFSADNKTPEALAACGIKVSSNYNLDYLKKTCKIDSSRFGGSGYDSEQNNYNQPFFYENKVIEMPLTCFYERNILSPSGRFGLKRTSRHMQITALSHPETEWMIQNADNLELNDIVIIFHSFEFVHIKDDKNNIGKPIFINIRRFEQLCDYLVRNQSKIEVRTMKDAARNPGWFQDSKNASVPKMPFVRTVAGKMEQLNKRIQMMF